MHKYFITVTTLHAPTRIRICCVFGRPHVSEFDTEMFESLIEHALMKKLRRLPRHGWAISAFLRHRFRKFAVTRVHTDTISLRCQKFPLWRAFSKVCGYIVRFRLEVTSLWGRETQKETWEEASPAIYTEE